jgi:hypothetical protein
MRSGKAKSHRSRKSTDIVRVTDNPGILKICKMMPLGSRKEVHNGKHFNQYTSSNITSLVK